MDPKPPPPPEPGEILRDLADLLRAYDGRRVGYVSAGGDWREDPVILEDRLVHHLVHRLSGRSAEAGEPPASLLGPLLDGRAWTACSALLRDEATPRPATVLLRAVGRFLQVEILRSAARRSVPAWDRAGQEIRRDIQARLAGEEGRLEALSGAEERRLLSERLLGAGPLGDMLRALAAHAAEEDVFLREIEDLRRRRSDAKPCPEAAGTLIEIIQPPQGIVTNTSPALLLPCLGLLAGEAFGPETGVPYTAAVILSILRDARSSAGLLRALKRIPLSCSKLRENIIYALGCLREDAAVPDLVAVLESPDEVPAGPGEEGGRVRYLIDQKIEAAWALGKIGSPAIPALSALASCADHPSPQLRTVLAWTLGRVGRAQREASGGIDADAVIALLKLLKVKDRQVFEETVLALRKIDLPEFVHSLYLYHSGAVSLHGLLPSQRGLYELSETLHHLIRSKGRVIMAVTGDSGTGKTYFCQAIAGGFGDIRPEEILYLMRDRKSGQKVYNRLLGLRWLKDNIDPAYYHDYPLSEEEDDPPAYLERFLEENRHKKLIILDGCRDRDYFQRVIDALYDRNALDVDVTFRASFSTRRQNLEEREMALESVKTHLAFLEEPALEDTPFYQEGIVLLYDFDNSTESRLDREEVLELFSRRKIDSWGDLIRLASFKRGKRTSPSGPVEVEIRTATWKPRREGKPAGTVGEFRPEERRLRALLNEAPGEEPNLLLTIDLGALPAGQLRLYARNQVAGSTGDGRLFVFSFIDNRLFLCRRGEGRGLTLLGRDLAVVGEKGGVEVVSFERNEIASFGALPTAGPARALASFGKESAVTGHEDGTVAVWDLARGTVRSFDLGPGSVQALACDRRGRVCAGTADGLLIRLDPNSGGARSVEFRGRRVTLVRAYLRDRVLVVTEAAAATAEEGSRIHILDLEAGSSRVFAFEPGGPVTGVSVDFDGRIIAGLLRTVPAGEVDGGNLVILEFTRDEVNASRLAGHALGTHDCLTMGPRIISCGQEEPHRTALRVWGGEFFVRTELDKQAVRAAWPSAFR